MSTDLAPPTSDESFSSGEGTASDWQTATNGKKDRKRSKQQQEQILKACAEVIEANTKDIPNMNLLLCAMSTLDTVAQAQLAAIRRRN